MILVLLDLSATFDTVEPQILLTHLEHHLGVTGSALAWFKAYFTDRAQCMSILGSKSAKAPLTRGVPQGSILGPIARDWNLVCCRKHAWNHGIGHFNTQWD